MELIQLEKVAILLDNDKTIYQSGQTISGSIKIRLNGELNLSIVSIVLRGMAEVKWMEIYGGVYIEGHYNRDNEMYLNDVYEIPENVKIPLTYFILVRNSKITSGQHSIPFVFKLPDNVPSSIETRHGFIKYWIEVIINYDSVEQEIYHDYRDKKYIIVESPFRRDLQLSVGGGTEKDFGVLSLGSGKVRIDASIRQRGHTPGETLEVHCLVTNTSTVAVTPRASFYKTQIYMTKNSHSTDVDTSEPVVGEKVKAGETSGQILSVQIPKDSPLSIKTRLITIKYFIHVTLDIPFATDLHLNLPLIVTNEYALNESNETL